jgi:hypothetical protein
MREQQVHSKSAARKKPYRSSGRQWLISLASVITLGAGICAAIAVRKFPVAMPASASSPQTENPANMQIGVIKQQSETEQCTVMSFENDSGRTVDTARHCEKTVSLDAHGNPTPVGTMHRLESISKSFMGVNH